MNTLGTLLNRRVWTYIARSELAEECKSEGRDRLTEAETTAFVELTRRINDIDRQIAEEKKT